MFLKRLLGVLLLANVGYFAYSQGWFGSWLGGDSAQREPQRLSKQINPESLTVQWLTTLATHEPAVPSNNNPIAPACATSPVERWVVYMGPYANKELQDKKQNELQRMGVAATEISKPSLKLGLSLGEFNDEAVARAALVNLARQGVKTATIVLWDTAQTACR